MPGLRLQLEIDQPEGCPVVAAASTVDGEATDVTWSDAGDATVEQFELDGVVTPLEEYRPTATATAPAAGGAEGAVSAAPAAADAVEPVEAGSMEMVAPGTDTAVTPVFEREDGAVYEFERPEGPCACRRIEMAGHPIADVRANDGSLFVTLHLDADCDVGALLRDVEEAADTVRIRSVSHAGAGDEPGDLVPVDRGRLTDRQREVLETAHGMGYFEYPRGANASEVAEALDICPSTLAEHLAAAQTKLLEDLLDSTPGELDAEDAAGDAGSA